MITDDITAEELAEVEELGGALDAGGYQLVEPWPYPPGIEGPLTTPDGTRASGAYVREVGNDLDLVVALNGWPIEHRRCPGPLPPHSAYLGPISSWISQQPTIARTDRGVVAVDPALSALARVTAGRKPLCLAEAESQECADRWVLSALEEDLAVHTEVSPDLGGPGRSVWFLAAARTEPFESLLDLDRLAEWYAEALEVAGASVVIDRVTTEVLDLRGSSPADFVTRTFDLVAAPAFDSTDEGIHSAVTGVVLGYWPPTTAAFLSDAAARDIGSRRFPRSEHRTWDVLRLAAASQLPRLTVAVGA